MNKVLRRAVIVLVTMLLVLSLCSCGKIKTVEKAANETYGEYNGKTIVLHSNDVHGAVESYTYMAGIKSYYESMGADVIVVDNGDFTSGATYVIASKGADAIKLMNAVGYDVMAFGNHEFDYGFDNAMENVKSFNGVAVCADVMDKNGKTITDASVIIEINGLKVGFFGMETPETMTKVNPGLIEGLKFLKGEEMYEQANKVAKKLSKKADVVICLSHLGVDEESEFKSVNFYANVENVDFVIDGHSHTVMTEGPDGEPIQSTGTQFENIGVVVIDNASKQIVDNFLIDCSLFNGYEDAEVSALTASIMEAVDSQYKQVFAKSNVVLNGAKAPGNRNEETNLGDLITDSMIWAVEKDLDVDEAKTVAITNGGGIRAYIYEGDVSKNDVISVLPFGNTLAVVYVTGAELLESLEASTYCTPASVGGFPQVAGIEFEINTAVEYDANAETYPDSTYYGPKSIKRVSIKSVNGQPFDANAVYTVITNNFCAAGGDTYYAYKRAYDAGDGFDTGITLDAALIDYIQQELGGTVGSEYAVPQGRITVK